MTDHADSHLSRCKARDRSIVLVLVGTVILMPPVAGIALIDAKIGGIPFSLLYVFVVWALLIAGAAALARPLLRSDGSTYPAETPDPNSLY